MKAMKCNETGLAFAVQVSRQHVGGLVGESQATTFQTCQTSGAELLHCTEKPSEALSLLNSGVAKSKSGLVHPDAGPALLVRCRGTGPSGARDLEGPCDVLEKGFYSLVLTFCRAAYL